MAALKDKKIKITVGVDDTLESVVELVEGMEEVEISFNPGVFFELPEEVLKKLDRMSLIKYGVAKECAAKDERDANRTFPKIEIRDRKLEFDQGNEISRKMKVPKDDKKWHYAVLDGMDWSSAKAQGYVPLDGEDIESNIVRATNKRTKEDEELIKVKIPYERYQEHMRAVSNESRRVIRAHQDSAIEGSDIVIKKDNEKVRIYEKGNERDDGKKGV